MCVESCPDKFMTLVKAYTNAKDFDYYKKYCKEGVTQSMVSCSEIVFFFVSSIILYPVIVIFNFLVPQYRVYPKSFS